MIRERNSLGVVGGLAILVLVGGCSTLAAMVLVHYERRRLELATKIALGISRIRLIGELSRELAVVCFVGAVSAVLVAVLGLRVMPTFRLPGGLDLDRLDLSLDWRVLGAAIAAAMATLLVAAWLPLARFTRSRLAGELWAGPAATASTASQRLRQVLLAAQTCLTVVVLVSGRIVYPDGRRGIRSHCRLRSEPHGVRHRSSRTRRRVPGGVGRVARDACGA